MLIRNANAKGRILRHGEVERQSSSRNYSLHSYSAFAYFIWISVRANDFTLTWQWISSFHRGWDISKFSLYLICLFDHSHAWSNCVIHKSLFSCAIRWIDMTSTTWSEVRSRDYGKPAYTCIGASERLIWQMIYGYENTPGLFEIGFKTKRYSSKSALEEDVIKPLL